MKRSRTNSSQEKTSLKRAQIYTQILQEELDSGLEILDRMRRQKQYMGQQVLIEVEKQNKIQAKIDYLKTEIQKLRLQTETNQQQLDQVREENLSMEAELVQLEAVVEGSLHQSWPTIHNDFSMLIEAVNKIDVKYERHKSVLLTCARDLIKITEENEFDDFNWRVKLASNQQRFGMKIRFEDLSLTQKDMKNVYLPVINDMATKFKRYRLELKTKWRRQNSLITGVEMTFSLPLKIRHAERQHEV